MHDPETLVKDFGLFQIWHVDPCKGPGGDDSCGWFMRAHHGDKKVLEAIVKRFEFDFDRTFTSNSKHTYYCGLFKPSGDPNFSVSGIVVNLFFIAAIEYFQSDGRTNWKKAKRWMRKNLLDILLFAENPTDSLFDTIIRKFEKACGEEYGDSARSERIRNLASTIYAWILRSDRPWYRHPRWHVHHWRINIPFLHRLKRFITSKCKTCNCRISPFDHGVVSHSWSGDGPYECGKCSAPQQEKTI